jgi:hypothetical protein
MSLVIFVNDFSLYWRSVFLKPIEVPNHVNIRFDQHNSEQAFLVVMLFDRDLATEKIMLGLIDVVRNKLR